MPSAKKTAREPQQERSRRTRDGLLAACERLLDERPFSDVTVKDIVAEAGSSAGSFYARFDTKHALLHALHQRLHDRGLRGVERAVARLEGSRLTPERFAHMLVGSTLHLHAANRGLLRAVLIESITDPSFAERAQHQMRESSRALARVIDAKGVSLARRAEAIESAQLAVMAILDQELFYGEALLGARRARAAKSPKEIARLERIALAAMGLGPHAPSRAPSKG